MLKANSKQAKENLFRVMVRECSGWDHDPRTAQEAAYILAHDFLEANKGPTGRVYMGSCKTYQDLFTEWGAGLTNSIFDQIFYFGKAKDLLGEILEETEEEKNRFSYDQACDKLCAFIWIHGGVSEEFYKLYKF